MSADEYDNARWAGIAALVSAAPDGTDVGVIRRIVEQELSAGRQVGTHNRADLVLRAHRESNLRLIGSDLQDGQPRLQRRRGKVDADLILRTQQIVRTHAPRIQAARVEAFGVPTAPFATLAEAVAWIESQPEADRVYPPDLVDRAQAAWTSAGESLDKLRAAVPGEWFRTEGSTRSIEYWMVDGEIPTMSRTFLRDNTAMLAIWRACSEVSTNTGLSAATVCAWLLTGAEPGGRISLNSEETAVLPVIHRVGEIRHVAEGRIAVDLDVRDLTDRRWNLVRQDIASRIRRSNPIATRSVRAPQQRVMEAVDKHGGPPTPRYQRAFWESVTKSLPKSLRREDWRAVARQYYRAVAVVRA